MADVASVGFIRDVLLQGKLVAGLLLGLRVELFYRIGLRIRGSICRVLAGKLKGCHIKNG